MRRFLDEDFLLSSPTARRLYHGTARGQPIFDYHCHLSPREIAENRGFSNIAEIWLGGDQYKWRAMRTNGVDERYITGEAPPYEKFLAWARTLPALLGNPLYQWTHLELQRYFGIDDVLDEDSAPAIWEAANARLAEPSFRVEGILADFDVRFIGTTDDPADSLEWHAAIRKAGRLTAAVAPTFRPDRAMAIERPDFPAYMTRLGQAAGRGIRSFAELCSVLLDRIDFFDSLGCRASDHGLERVPYEPASEAEVSAAFAAALAGAAVEPRLAEAYRTQLLALMARAFARKGWAMQLHLNAIRSINRRAFERHGADCGFDAVNDNQVAPTLARFLDLLESTGELPKTILYSLNPADYYPLATIIDSFPGQGVAGKMQFGAAWWFCDHRDGMEAQLRILANVGLLPRFIGMLTDSRSFLSYPRHEYFRRILCDLLGRWAEAGEIPSDESLLAKTVADICYGNALRYFSPAAAR